MGVQMISGEFTLNVPPGHATASVMLSSDEILGAFS